MISSQLSKLCYTDLGASVLLFCQAGGMFNDIRVVHVFSSLKVAYRRAWGEQPLATRGDVADLSRMQLVRFVKTLSGGQDSSSLWRRIGTL